MTLELGDLNPVLSLDGVAITGKNYGDNIYPVDNFYIGKSKSCIIIIGLKTEQGPIRHMTI